MGLYGDVLNKLDDGLYVKIEPGKPMKLRLLDHPRVSQRKFEGGDVSTRFAWPVWDYAQERVRILQQGKSIFEQIANAMETWPGADQMPAPFDITITRTGTGQYDTKYSVTPTPYVAGVPLITQLDMPNMVEKVGGLALQDVVNGEQVPIVGDDAQAPALEAGTADVLPTDADVQNINLDDIPF